MGGGGGVFGGDWVNGGGGGVGAAHRLAWLQAVKASIYCKVPPWLHTTHSPSYRPAASSKDFA